MNTILKSSLVLLTLCLAACSKDKPKEITFLGEWSPVEEVVLDGNTKEEINRRIYGECKRKSSLKIEANGQVEFTNFAKDTNTGDCVSNGAQKMTYIYNKEEKKFVFTITKFKQRMLATIEKLTENELVLNFYSKDENNDEKEDNRIVYLTRKK